MATDTDLIMVVPDEPSRSYAVPAIVCNDETVLEQLIEKAQEMASELGRDVRIYRILETELLYKITPEEETADSIV